MHRTSTTNLPVPTLLDRRNFLARAGTGLGGVALSLPPLILGYVIFHMLLQTL